MKALLTCCLIVVGGVTADTMAQELLPAPANRTAVVRNRTGTGTG